MSNNKIWEKLVSNIKPKISESNYNKWIMRLRYIGTADKTIKLGAPDNFVKNWIHDYYQELIIQELYTITKKNFKLDINVIEGVDAKENDPGSLQTNLLEEKLRAQTEKVETAHNVSPPPKADVNQPFVRPKMRIRDNAIVSDFHKLNQKYSFEKFVVGSSNQFAHAAASAAADLPGGHYNPLFIYGGVGLGKTHLLQSVGLKIAQTYPNSIILYMSAEQFMNELIFCLRFEKMDQFRKKYRDGCDTLLIDDIQFMIGKERTQEEFFHTFNTLYESQKQIVVTSDRLPGQLDGLAERLRSRFEWGLIADIQPPDLETRIAILKKKAEQNNIYISDDVFLFLASQIRSNVRELEGSLIRLSAFASLEKKKEITVDFAKVVLKNIIKEKTATCSIEAIQRAVSDFYHVKVSDLKSSRRLKSISNPRQIAMYLCKEHLEASYPEIGHKFGGKDHSTVIHAVKKISTNIKDDDSLKRDIELIEKSLID